MLDDETIEMLLGPGIMPGTEITWELPVVMTPEFEELPPDLAQDPIVTMAAPQAVYTVLFDHYYGRHPQMIPARPHRSPRVPLRPRDHLLAALGAGVIVLGAATYLLVHSGWRADLPRSEQERLKAAHTLTAPVLPPITPVRPSLTPPASAGHIAVPAPRPRRTHSTPSSSPSLTRTTPSALPTTPEPSQAPPSPSPSPTPSVGPPVAPVEPAPSASPTPTPTPTPSSPVVIVLPSPLHSDTSPPAPAPVH